MSKSEQRDRLMELLAGQRWAALATIDETGHPRASMVGYRMCEESDGVLLHLSRLAEHTRNLLRQPHAALVVSACDHGSEDPQQLPRATLQGEVAVIERDDARYPRYRAHYLAALPDAERLFDFPDFVLFRLAVDEIRFVGGFAQAFTYRPAELAGR